MMRVSGPEYVIEDSKFVFELFMEKTGNIDKIPLKILQQGFEIIDIDGAVPQYLDAKTDVINYTPGLTNYIFEFNNQGKAHIIVKAKAGTYESIPIDPKDGNHKCMVNFSCAGQTAAELGVRVKTKDGMPVNLKYEDKNMGFSIQAPPGWQEKVPKMEGNVAILVFYYHKEPDVCDKAAINIACMKISDGMTLEKFYDQYRTYSDVEQVGHKMSKEEYEQVSADAEKGIAVNKEIETVYTTIGTIPAIQSNLLYTGKKGDARYKPNTLYKAMIYIMINNVRAYIIRCEAEENQFAGFEQDFNESIKSLKFLS